MTTFIASNNATDPPAEPMANLAFYPAISLIDFRADYRVDDTATDQRTVVSLNRAMIRVNDELKAWRVTQEDLGYATLDDIPSDNYGGVSALEWHYLSAIYNNAKADLIESYRDFDSTRSGHDKADEMVQRIDDQRRRGREELRLLLNITRITVELI